MSYSLYSERGHVGFLATIEDWEEVFDYIHQSMPYELVRLLRDGFTTRPQTLALRLSEFLDHYAVPLQVRHTLRTLIKLLLCCNDIGIVGE